MQSIIQDENIKLVTSVQFTFEIHCVFTLYTHAHTWVHTCTWTHTCTDAAKELGGQNVTIASYCYKQQVIKFRNKVKSSRLLSLSHCFTTPAWANMSMQCMLYVQVIKLFLYISPIRWAVRLSWVSRLSPRDNRFFFFFILGCWRVGLCFAPRPHLPPK